MRIEAIFSKKGDMRFISHLDLMRLFHRALRRADIPVLISKGFSPHFKISIRKALKLGVESENEELAVTMSRDMAAADFKELLNKNLPEGVRIIRSEAVT